MVDSINNTSASSLLRAQQLASTQQAQTRPPQAIITQTRAAAVTPVKASATPQTLKVASANSNLPRGSIVDKLV